MEAQFQELLDIDKILGAVLISLSGEKLFEQYASTALQILPPDHDWPSLIKTLDGTKEADFIFENKRLYFRRANASYLMVIMEPDAPSAMVRLVCGTIVSAIKTGSAKPKKGKGLFGRFK